MDAPDVGEARSRTVTLLEEGMFLLAGEYPVRNVVGCYYTFCISVGGEEGPIIIPRVSRAVYTAPPGGGLSGGVFDEHII